MDILKNFSTDNWIALSAIIIPIAITLGVYVFRQILTVKEHMKKKILKKVNELTNQGHDLFAEIKVRDAIYLGHLWHAPLLKKRFFTLFIESIRELYNSEVINRVDGRELFSPYKLYEKEKRVNPFPPYNSCISITPANYPPLAKDNPNMYIGLKANECDTVIESFKKDGQYRLAEISKHY